VVDLGCGPGNVTAQLQRRWPDAQVTGIDNSEAMVDAARADQPEIDFVVGDIDSWKPTTPPEVVFSNAALHWLGNHQQLFPRLLRQVPVGGWLAVQVPASFAAPSHTVAQDIASSDRWREQLAGALPDAPVADPVDYHRWLTPVASELDVWETTYLHDLVGPDPVFDWFRGSWLRPVLARLDGREAAAFEEEYRNALAELYPPDDSGSVVMGFRRIFVIACRAA
jgi:trans-aconitate 2-methyltransferase